MLKCNNFLKGAITFSYRVIISLPMEVKDTYFLQDLKDEKFIQKHLNIIVQQIGILSCSKCDFSHKNVKSYLEHVDTCEGSEESLVSKILLLVLDLSSST